MELGAHIKEHRKELGLSQDDLAAKIYVSRQTISNWEVGRTYPDVQSLLLLSNVFGVTVDSLIKGDVETMAQVMDAAVKKYNALSTITVVSAVVFWRSARGLPSNSNGAGAFTSPPPPCSRRSPCS